MADDVEQPEDLRDVISRAFDEQTQKDAEPEAPKATADATPDEKPVAEERPRGPDGKFIAKADGDEGEAPAQDTDAVQDTPAAAIEAEDERVVETPKVTGADVPQHWSQADKEMVASLPAEHQGKVVDRIKAIEAGFTPKLQRAAQLEREWAPAAQVFEPYMHQLRSAGQTPTDVIKAWAAVELDLAQGLNDANMGRPNQKAAARIATLISHYRVDPAQVAEFLANPQAARMPAMTGGMEVPPEVMREIEGLKAREAAREQAELDARVSTAQQQIDAFAAEKDAKGALLHPYFSEVQAKMEHLARAATAAGQPIVLAELYDEAVYANRDTRTKLLAAREAEVKQRAAADRKAKAEAAQRAASSVTGAPGGNGQTPRQPTGQRTLREELEAAYDEQDAA